MSFAALCFFSEACAPTLARLARIDPIVSLQSVKGNKFPASFSIRSLSASVAAYPRPSDVTFARRPRLCRMLQGRTVVIHKGLQIAQGPNQIRRPVTASCCQSSPLGGTPFAFASIERFVASRTTTLGQRRVVMRLARDFTEHSSQTRLTRLQFPLSLIRFLQT